MAMRLPMDVTELLERAAAHPDGARPLFFGQLECVAALYQVHPFRVEQLRARLEDPAMRDEAERLVARLERLRATPPGGRTATTTRTAEAVILDALSKPNGVEVLMQAPVEMAAVLLQAHPFVVEQARARLASRPAVAHPPFTVVPPRASAPAFSRSVS